MKEPRNHLPRDLQALRYLDAVDAGDLEAVAALWDEASRDPALERLLAELDGELAVEEAGASREASAEGARRLPPQHLPGSSPAPQPSAVLSAGDRAAKLPVDIRTRELGPSAVDRRANARLLGSQNPLPAPLGPRPRRWAVWSGVVGASAAAGLLAVLAWLARDGTKTVPSPGPSAVVHQDTVPSPEPSKSPHPGTPRPLEDSAGTAAWLEARRVLLGAEPPTFTWPLQETSAVRRSIAIPPDLLD